MKTSKADFNKFKQEFLKWVKDFGLTGYLIQFRHENLEDSWSEIKIDGDNKIATVYFTIGYTKEDKPNYRGPAIYAKHEAIHLLLGQLYHLCHSRFLHSREYDEAEESLVWKLEKLIGEES